MAATLPGAKLRRVMRASRHCNYGVDAHFEAATVQRIFAKA
jgi:hypothetical protein